MVTLARVISLNRTFVCHRSVTSHALQTCSSARRWNCPPGWDYFLSLHHLGLNLFPPTHSSPSLLSDFAQVSNVPCSGLLRLINLEVLCVLAPSSPSPFLCPNPNFLYIYISPEMITRISLINIHHHT